MIVHHCNGYTAAMGSGGTPGEITCHDVRGAKRKWSSHSFLICPPLQVDFYSFPSQPSLSKRVLSFLAPGGTISFSFSSTSLHVISPGGGLPPPLRYPTTTTTAAANSSSEAHPYPLVSASLSKATLFCAHLLLLRTSSCLTLFLIAFLLIVFLLFFLIVFFMVFLFSL